MSSRRCRAAPVRLAWATTAECPALHNTDAIQIMTNQILDAADAVAESGLAASGYELLALPACEALQHPSHRVSLVSYTRALGLTLVFAQADATALRARLLEKATYPSNACIAQALSDTSGPAGWNDPRAAFSLDASASMSFDERLRRLRLRFTQACMHRRPLVLAPSVRMPIATALPRPVPHPWRRCRRCHPTRLTRPDVASSWFLIAPPPYLCRCAAFSPRTGAPVSVRSS